MPFENVCIISDRPCRLERDAAGHLHCETAAAMEYRDGWKIWAWHGLRVPERIIMQPETIGIDEIFAQSNAEIRRVMQERYGWQRFFTTMKKQGRAKLLDTKPDISGMPVSLYAFHDNEVTSHFVHVYNGTIEPDGTRHEFTINCKNIGNDAFASVMGTYPDLMERLKDNPRRLELLRAAVRT